MFERLAWLWPQGLRQRLLLALAAPLSLVLGLALLLNHQATQRLTDEAFDKALLNVAVALAARVEIDTDHDLDVDLPVSAQALLQADTTDQMRLAVFDEDERLVWGDGGLQACSPSAAAVGLAGALAEAAVQTVNCEGQVLRVLALPRQGPFWRARVMVGETTRKREAAAQRLLLNSGTLGLALWACALLTLWWVTRAMLGPLERTAAALAQRPAGEWAPLDIEGLPLELRALLGAINGLLLRLQALSQAQQRFIGDVAHQLRTPLAGLRLQLDLLRQDGGKLAAPVGSPERMAQMTQALDRMGRLVGKLLALARAEADGLSQEPLRALDLRDTAEACANEFIDQAQHLGIELSFELASAQLLGRAGDLHEMASNLLENAFLHGRPEQAHVCMRTGLHEGQAFLEVEDDGPGMPAGLASGVSPSRWTPIAQERSAGRAHHGTGLGLAIVRTIAEQHGARIDWHTGAQGQGQGQGTRVRMSFPAAPLSGS
ncbi:sensor histidine kinase [Paucibacter sp. Y2R2-4]|uniref:sensor histidine kinase n=1 Tax=Paucibacter sp. Y2R2-4 TaxID=2893553 RepID=UPI0021E494D5|nr:sensor histidine kinase [Paucibacter sp. Y2R2-4]MCV2351131.1 sensor histidine kinase [Paucibacter sp. Y2R2-4]